MTSSFAAFGPRNYRLMGLGLAALAAGFITMTLDTADYGEGFLGITLGPILLVLGFVLEFFAIMLRDPAAVVGATPNAGAPPMSITMTDAGAGLATARPTLPPAAPTRPSYKPL